MCITGSSLEQCQANMWKINSSFFSKHFPEHFHNTRTTSCIWVFFSALFAEQFAYLHCFQFPSFLFSDILILINLISYLAFLRKLFHVVIPDRVRSAMWLVDEKAANSSWGKWCTDIYEESMALNKIGGGGVVFERTLNWPDMKCVSAYDILWIYFWPCPVHK